MDIKNITSEEAESIIDSRKPLGQFWFKENEFYIGIDNETGEAWTEEFKDKDSCIEWLMGVEKEFKELKLKCDSKNCTGQCEICQCNEEETCGNPYSDLWVQLKWTIEGSEYCKTVREEDTAPAFGSALCQKCIDKRCRFIDICIALYEMN